MQNRKRQESDELRHTWNSDRVVAVWVRHNRRVGIPVVAIGCKYLLRIHRLVPSNCLSGVRGHSAENAQHGAAYHVECVVDWFHFQYGILPSCSDLWCPRKLAVMQTRGCEYPSYVLYSERSRIAFFTTKLSAVSYRLLAVGQKPSQTIKN